MQETVDRAFFARIRGDIIDIVRAFGPADDDRESLRSAIDRLSQSGKIPQTTVRLLHLLLSERNDAEYRARSFEGVEADQIRKAWASVQLWAHSAGVRKQVTPTKVAEAIRSIAPSDRRRLLEAVVDCLNHRRVRATYGAVGELLGVPAQSIGQMLGSRRPSASWIVNTASGLPTGYSPAEMHPELERTSEIVRTGVELRRRMLTDPKR